MFDGLSAFLLTPVGGDGVDDVYGLYEGVDRVELAGRDV